MEKSNMVDERYDVSRTERRIIEENAQRRVALRQEYIKLISDPHRHGTGEGGTVFDAGVQRFMSMRATGYDHFKPTPRSSAAGLLLVVAPIALYCWMLKSSRDAQELKYRAGEIAYKDRKFKFI